jgi:glycosyltransferase involved in cell wall biosynthesis
VSAPFLSVVMPSFNGARWIAGALESVRAQADPSIEVIIVDGDEGDETERIVDRFRSELNIRYLRRPDLATWQAKTNFAVAEAAADHIAMLHVDDLWLPGRAAAVRTWVASAPHAVCHLSPSQLIDLQGRRIGTWRCPFGPSAAPIERDQLIERLLVQNFISCPAPVILRSAWLELGGMDEALWYTADWDFYLKLAAAGPVIYHPDALTAFRIHGSSLTVSGSRDPADFERQMQTVLDRHRGLLSPEAADETLRIARTSIAINTNLAIAAAGSRIALWTAFRHLLALWPRQLLHYWQWSRFGDRVIPRLRLRLAGRM